MRLGKWQAAGVAALVTLAAAAAAVAQADGPSLHEWMKAVIDPAANAFWAAGNDAPEGETAAAAALRWTAAAAAAVTLETEGRKLAALPFALGGDWDRYAKVMVEAAVDGRKAAEARDTEAAFEAGGRLYEACEGCHAKYSPDRGG